MAWCGSLLGVLWLLTFTQHTLAQVLTPPYFNLAENRRITATATCGEGVAESEEYCKLVGANADRGSSTTLFQLQGGQVSSIVVVVVIVLVVVVAVVVVVVVVVSSVCVISFLLLNWSLYWKFFSFYNGEMSEGSPLSMYTSSFVLSLQARRVLPCQVNNNNNDNNAP